MKGIIFMSNKNEGKANKPFEIPRPIFPKRAVVTGGMPYGNKELHFGHVGGMLVFADTYARFLRDRIGKENVVFVSGTDCYGSPIAGAKDYMDPYLAESEVIYPADSVLANGSSYAFLPEEITRFVENLFMEVRVN